MVRKLTLALVLAFAASLAMQVIAASQASAASKCTYTHSDKKKGYKC